MSGLYANLLGDTSTPAANSSTTISKAPVVFSNSSGISPSPNEDAGAPSSSSQKKINAGT